MTIKKFTEADPLIEAEERLQNVLTVPANVNRRDEQDRFEAKSKDS